MAGREKKQKKTQKVRKGFKTKTVTKHQNTLKKKANIRPPSRTLDSEKKKSTNASGKEKEKRPPSFF